MRRVVLLAIMTAGCSNAVDSARRAITASEKAITGAAGILERYDRDHQLSIAREAVTLGDPGGAKARLDDWDVKFKQAENALRSAQAVAEMGESIVELVAAGSKSKDEIAGVLPKVVYAIDKVREALRAIGIEVP